MANGTKYNTKQELLNSIQALVYQNDNNETTSDNIQKVAKNITESLMEGVVIDTEDYTVYRNIVDTEFVIRVIFKKTAVITNLELLPPNLAVVATFHDMYYISYHTSSTGNVKYTLSLTFNKLVSNNPFILAGDAYRNQIHLFDDVSDSSGSFNYTTAGGTGNYDSAVIRTTGFNVSGTITQEVDSSYLTPGGVLEFVFKGNLIGKL